MNFRTLCNSIHPQQNQFKCILGHFSCFSSSLQSHSIHGMTDEEEGNRPYKNMGILTYEEKKFLLAVERGDVASVRR